MAQAIAARRRGDDFQARMFWVHALDLLKPDSHVVRVAYETTCPKGFDDILIEYDKEGVLRDNVGSPIHHRYIQCKWHTKAGNFGYENLIDPGFIHAKKISFLQKAHCAQKKYAPDGQGCRFELHTNWRINQNDPLLKLILKNNNALDHTALFDSTGDRSKMGKVRKCWREHLGIDDSSLQLVVQTLSVVEIPDSLVDIRERLNDRLESLEFRSYPESESNFPYDDLLLKLLDQGDRHVDFDKSSFMDMAQREGLLVKKAKTINIPSIGVQSFKHQIDNLEDQCDYLLDLCGYFDGRYIKNGADWQVHIFPELKKFIIDRAQSNDRLRVTLDTHVSIAFAAGTLLNVKSGRQIEIKQRNYGSHNWLVDDASPDVNWPQFIFEDEYIEQEIKGQNGEIALAISLTHDVGADVRTYVKAVLPHIGCIIYCRLDGGTSQKSVHSGCHAQMLAEGIVKELRNCRLNISHIHLFIAGPNGFAFFLGQLQQGLGSITVYEYDYDGLRNRNYQSGLSFSNTVA